MSEVIVAVIWLVLFIAAIVEFSNTRWTLW